MSTRKTQALEPVEAPGDEHAGQGGSYVLDPETGVRTLVARTMSRDDRAQVGQADNEQGGV